MHFLHRLLAVRRILNKCVKIKTRILNSYSGLPVRTGYHANLTDT